MARKHHPITQQISNRNDRYQNYPKETESLRWILHPRSKIKRNSRNQITFKKQTTLEALIKSQDPDTHGFLIEAATPVAVVVPEVKADEEAAHGRGEGVEEEPEQPPAEEAQLAGEQIA